MPVSTTAAWRPRVRFDDGAGGADVRPERWSKRSTPSWAPRGHPKSEKTTIGTQCRLRVTRPPQASPPDIGSIRRSISYRPARLPESTAVLQRGSGSDSIRIMSTIRITSAENPFDSQRLARLAVGLITTAEAMGLLGEMEIHRLDLSTFRRIVDRIAAAGIGTEVQAALSAPMGGEPAELRQLLGRLATAIEESPAPAHEWRSLERLFGAERLADLVGVSTASVRRYAAATRDTPDVIAGRLHFLATVVGDLAGAYNEIGIRRWFERRRTLLDGRAPAELLAGEWDPEGPGARRVRDLARSLGASAAT